MLKKLLQKDEGFTLIEVVLVLAIAGLIMVIVFLAVGGAQRTRRDTARKNNAGRVLSAMESYASNNGGAYATAALTANYLNNITDPNTNSTPEYGNGPATALHPTYYSSGRVCSSTTQGATVGGGGNNAAVSYWSEVSGSATCIDNN